MKFKATFATFYYLTNIVLANSAIILDVSEFAHFPEISSTNSQHIISQLYNNHGSHFPLVKLDNSKDGTRYFPSLRNSREVFKDRNDKTLIYISSHLKIHQSKLFIALPESNPSDITSFLSVKDLGINSSILIIQPSSEITNHFRSAFKDTFKNFNGAAMLVAKEHKFFNLLLRDLKMALK